MTDEEPGNIVLNILRKLQDGQSRLEHGQNMTNERLSAVEHHLAGLVVSVNRFNDDLDELKSRVHRIERRLELTDDPADEPGG